MSTTLSPSFGSRQSYVTVYNTPNGVYVCARGYDTDHQYGTLRCLNDEEKQFQNTLRTMNRQVHNTLVYSSANNFSYFVTLSFSELQSTKGFGLGGEFVSWLREHARCNDFKAKFYLVILPSPENTSVWHIHMLLGDVPDGEFTPLEENSRSLTEDAKAKISAGAVLYGWPAFESRFNSIAYIEKFGDKDECGVPIEQMGKAKYLARQFFIKKSLTAKDGSVFVKYDLPSSVEFYRKFVPEGKHPFRHSKLVNPKPFRKVHLPREQYEALMTCSDFELYGFGGTYEYDKEKGREFIESLDSIAGVGTSLTM